MIPQERISDRLYNDLLNSILLGEYSVGGKLPTEFNLAHDYGISRTTVRVALARLKQEGFVVSRQGAGTVVADFKNGQTLPFASDESLADLEKCFECRIIIEPEIAAIVAQLRTNKDIAYLENHIALLARLIQKGNAHTAEDTDFHLYLASLSDNKFFESIMVSLRPHILIGMNLIKVIPQKARDDHARQSLKEHTDIVNALITRDKSKAKAAMRYHLENSRQRIFKSH